MKYVTLILLSLIATEAKARTQEEIVQRYCFLENKHDEDTAKAYAAPVNSPEMAILQQRWTKITNMQGELTKEFDKKRGLKGGDNLDRQMCIKKKLVRKKDIYGRYIN